MSPEMADLAMLTGWLMLLAFLIGLAFGAIGVAVSIDDWKDNSRVEDR